VVGKLAGVAWRAFARRPVPAPAARKCGCRLRAADRRAGRVRTRL